MLLRLFSILLIFKKTVPYFLIAPPQVVLQYIRKSFKGVHWGCKNKMNFTCVTMIFHNCYHAIANDAFEGIKILISVKNIPLTLQIFLDDK